MNKDLIDQLIANLGDLRQRLEESDGAAPSLRGDVDRAKWLTGILAHSPDVISVLDVDGTLLFLNRAAAGRDPTSFVGRNAADFVPPSHREKWLGAVRAAAAGGGPQRVEVYSAGDYFWDTRIIPIEQDGRPTWLLSIGTDITAQRSAEAALQLKHQQLELALTATGMGQWSWNVKEDVFTLDEASWRIFDWPSDNPRVDSRTLLDRVHKADRARVKDAMRAALETGAYQDVQCRIVAPDGSTRWIFSKGRTIADAEGNVHTVMGGLMDITHGKRTDEQLQRSAKLEAIGQLAGGIAHDFNNLLVAILGNLDLALDSSDVGQTRARIGDAASAANKAAELTRQLLVFSRRQPLDQTSLDYHELLDDTLSLLRRLLPENISVELIRARRLPRVLGDRGQLEQVLINLCVNARDAMPSGGKLTIETESVLVNGNFRQTHPWASEGRYVLVTVTDTGTGIAPEHIDHVFEPFFTTKTQGTGLGLATAYGVIKRHGGLLHVYSELGKGTTFKVYLPIAERDASEVGSKVDGPVVGGHETILLAEDEPAVQAVVKRILERAGYTVLCASDGERAVELYRQHGARIDALVLDAVMPRKGGAEALSEIRASNPQIPVVMSSGYSDPQDRWDTRQHNVAFLAKPYEPDCLLRLLRAQLDLSASTSHTPES